MRGWRQTRRMKRIVRAHPDIIRRESVGASGSLHRKQKKGAKNAENQERFGLKGGNSPEESDGNPSGASKEGQEEIGEAVEEKEKTE